MIWRSALVVLTGLVLGVGSAAGLILTGGSSGSRVQNGPWETSLSAGARTADPYTRARVAIFGLWALPASEVIYFTALEDQEGRPLDRRCRYTVGGGPLPARWWSVTLYRDFFFISNPAERHSWSRTALGPDADRAWSIDLNAAGDGTHGLPMGERDGRFALLLRLYHPGAEVAGQAADLTLPTIRRLSCAGGPA